MSQLRVVLAVIALGAAPAFAQSVDPEASFNAGLSHLREARPRSSRREVFLNLRAPFGPMCCSDLGYLVRTRLRALGVTLPHYGPHALRQRLENRRRPSGRP